MKKSELKNFIREEIMSTLSEDIEDDIKALDAYDAKLDDVIKKKEEAGIEEKVAKSVDDVIDPADYIDIGRGYLKGFKRPHSLKDDDLETLGRKIVKVLAKGNIDKAKAAFVNENINEGDLFSSKFDRQELKAIINDLNEQPIFDMAVRRAYKFLVSLLDKEDKEEMGLNESIPALEKMDTMKREIRLQLDSFDKGIIDGDDLANAMEEIVFGRRAPGMREEIDLNEDEDKEPSDAEIKKNKSLAKAAEELAVLTREMKSLAKKYSKAEGQEKEDLLKKLKSKTKLKKELDKILDK